jgi:hypothetical protein
MTFSIYIIMKFILLLLYIRDFRFWRIAPWRQHIRTSAEVGSHKYSPEWGLYAINSSKKK